jgi:hypothetical protein
MTQGRMPLERTGAFTLACAITVPCLSTEMAKKDRVTRS